MQDQNIKYIKSPNGYELAYQYNEKKGPCLMWLCGFHSDMEGSKAIKMAQTAMNCGLSSLLFDYSGHGLSGGNFEDGTISQWIDDARFIINELGIEDLVLVGSSMGGWISIKLGMELGARLKSMVLIAPAPDFTEDLMWNAFSESVKHQILNDGFWIRPSEYDDQGYKITDKLIKDGRQNLILRGEIDIMCPIKIIHGTNDDSVPFTRSLELINKLKSDDIDLIFIKNGDHRLSSERDINRLGAILEQVIKSIP